MKSEEVKSKNPERFRIQDFLAPPAGLAKQKGAGGTFLQAVSATRTGAKRNQATYSHAAGVARGKFASQDLHLCLVSFAPSPQVGANVRDRRGKKGKTKTTRLGGFCFGYVV